MATLPFRDLYISECEVCGADLENWDWLEDDMMFHTSCTCGAEYNLEPITGNLVSETENIVNDEDEE